MDRIDVNFQAPSINSDPAASRQLAAAFAKLRDILNYFQDSIGKIKIITTAPTDKELVELLNTSDVVILHHATQSSRRIYYKYQGTVYVIASA